MRSEVHAARKEYRCGAPYGPCDRRILRGQAYTQLTWGPGEPPFNLPTWTVIRACSDCAALPEGADAPDAPCPAHNAELQCQRTANHPPPHEYPIGLF